MCRSVYLIIKVRRSVGTWNWACARNGKPNSRLNFSGADESDQSSTTVTLIFSLGPFTVAATGPPFPLVSLTRRHRIASHRGDCSLATPSRASSQQPPPRLAPPNPPPDGFPVPSSCVHTALPAGHPRADCAFTGRPHADCMSAARCPACYSPAGRRLPLGAPPPDPLPHLFFRSISSFPSLSIF